MQENLQPNFQIPCTSNFTTICEDENKVIFGIYSDKKLNGHCRIQYFDMKTVQGDFKDNQCENAIEYQINGGFTIGSWKNNNFDGKAKMYNYQRELKFEGTYYMQQNKIKRNGTEYNSNNQSEGIWIQNIKNGQFTQRLENGQIILKVEYKNGKQIKCTQIQPKPKDQDQEQKSSRRIKKINENEDQKTQQFQYYNNRSGVFRYNYVLSSKQLEGIKSDNRMIDTSVISIWAAQLQHNLYKKHEFRVQIFGTQLIQYYAGTQLNFRSYDNVRHMLNSFRGNFGLFSGFYQLIIFPVIFKIHFILCVVRVKKINGRIKLQYACYDSYQHQNKQLFEVMKDFISDQLKNKKIKSQQMIRSLDNIQIVNVIVNPRQNDGSSCGIFVCKFMFDLSTRKCITDLQNKQLDIAKFRQKIYKILKYNYDPYKFENIEKIKVIASCKSNQETKSEQQQYIITMPRILPINSNIKNQVEQSSVGVQQKVSNVNQSSLKSSLRTKNN